METWRHAILAVAVVAGLPASADERRPPPSPEALAVAQELFTVTFERAGAQINAQAVDQTWPSIENALRAKNPMLDSSALSSLRQEFERIRLEKIRALMKDGPTIYARHLSEVEMREVIGFYRTPAGTRLMQVAPSVVAELFAIALPNMPTVINDTHEEFLRLARARGYIE